MMNLKNQRGSITVFVLVSCLLLLGCVICVQTYMQSKQIAVERQYRQIKDNYGTDVENLEAIYSELYQKQQEILEEKAKAEMAEEQSTPEEPAEVLYPRS